MFSSMRSFFRTLFNRVRFEHDMDDEIKFHISCRKQDLINQGLHPDEAERQAMIEFGSRENYKELCRESIDLNVMDNLKRDFRFGFHLLRKNPIFTATLCLTLGIAIGTNTAVFELAYSILFKPLPYPDSDRLVRMTTIDSKTGHIYQNSLADVDDMLSENKSFEGIGGFSTYTTDVIKNGSAESEEVCDITPSILSLLKVQPIAGRWLLPEEDKPGSDSQKVVISYDFWQRHFSGDPKSVVGKQIRTSISTLKIVGVMPQGFGFPRRTALWTPAQNWYSLYSTIGRKGNRGSRIYEAVARLRPGVSLAQAENELTGIANHLGKLYPATNPGYKPRLISLHEAETAALRPYLLLLLATASFVLVLCCANIGNLLLAKSTGRAREMALRTALGATRSAIIRQLLMEGMLISILGGLIGLVLAIVGIRFLAILIPVPLPVWMQIKLHIPVLLFNIAISFGAGLLASLAPVLHLSVENAMEYLKDAAKGSSGRSHGFRNSLVICQIAISTVLLVAAGLTTKSFLYLSSSNPGFDTSGLVTARTAPQRQGNRQERIDKFANFYQRGISELHKLPGVVSVGVATSIPFDNKFFDRFSGSFFVKGNSLEDQHPRLSATIATITPEYFDALGAKIIQGRAFNELDTTKSALVVIITQETAQELWPGQNPIGQEIQWRSRGSTDPWRKVIGVVSDIQYEITEPNSYQVYFPYRQQHMDPGHFIVRTTGDTRQLLQATRKIISSIDPELAVSVTTMQAFAENSIWQQRLSGLVIGLFAILALLLATIGIYGVLSYSVSRRAREIAIRLALGARRQQVLAAVMREGTRLIFTGLTIGLITTLIIAHKMSSLLYGISPRDKGTFLLVSLILVLISILACFIPARRAMRVDPSVTLHNE